MVSHEQSVISAVHSQVSILPRTKYTLTPETAFSECLINDTTILDMRFVHCTSVISNRMIWYRTMKVHLFDSIWHCTKVLTDFRTLLLHNHHNEVTHKQNTVL